MDDEEAMDEEIERELTEEARNNNNEQKDIEVHERPWIVHEWNSYNLIQ